MLRYLVISLALLLAALPSGAAAQTRGLTCFSEKEMRERIKRQNLANPLMLMRAHARRHRARPLHTRLCRRGGALVYQFALLGRDGKVIRIETSAWRQKAPPRK